MKKAQSFHQVTRRDFVKIITGIPGYSDGSDDRAAGY